jgi:hypothetical protein
VSLKFYMDHHVHGAITRGLRRRRVDCLTLQEDGTDREDDELLLFRAMRLGRVLVSGDDDLLKITTEWMGAGRPFAGLLFCHPLRVTIGQAIEDIHLMSEVLDQEEMNDNVQYLPL